MLKLLLRIFQRNACVNGLRCFLFKFRHEDCFPVTLHSPLLLLIPRNDQSVTSPHGFNAFSFKELMRTMKPISKNLLSSHKIIYFIVFFFFF